MFRKTYDDRVLGMAAEAGFWGIVSLPSFALSVFGAIGYLRSIIGDDTIDSVRDDVLRAARAVLTPSTVNTDVAPLVNQILSGGQPAVISIGFLIALWAGSTCMADYVNTITVAYEQRGLRSWPRTRLRSLYLYLLAVASGIVILPALALGPNEISKLFPHSLQNSIHLTVQILYIPVVGLGSILVVAGLYRLSLPRPIPFRRGLPGATLAVALWLSGSFAVRVYLTSSFHNRSAYGALSAPIAALIFFYVTALAVLLGAELNAAIDVVHARPLQAQPRRRPGLRQWLAQQQARRWRRRSGTPGTRHAASGPADATSTAASRPGSPRAPGGPSGSGTSGSGTGGSGNDRPSKPRPRTGGADGGNGRSGQPPVSGRRRRDPIREKHPHVG